MRKGLFAALALALAVPAALSAQTPQPIAMTAPVQYRVRPGDTLLRLAPYFANPGAAAEIARANGIADSARLAPGTILTIPLDLLRTEALGAKVIAFRGDVTIGRQGAARLGMMFGEGIRIATGGNSSVSFQLADGTAVTLPSLSTIRIVRLRRVLLTNKVHRILALDNGRSESQVTPSKDGATSFEIRTPVSVAAVRGTDFRVSYAEEERAATQETLKGAVGVSGADGEVATPAGFGVRSDAQSTGKPTALLPPPEVLSPVRHRRDGTLIFTFAKMDEALAYRIVLSGDPDFRDLRAETTTRTLEAVVPALPSGTYYIRATAIDVHGLEGLSVDYPYDHHIAFSARDEDAPPRSGG